MDSRRVALSRNNAATQKPRRQTPAITRSLAASITTVSGGRAAAVHTSAYQPDIGGNKLDDTGGMGGRALSTTHALAIGNDTRRRGFLAHVLLGGQSLDFRPAGQRLVSTEVRQKSALRHRGSTSAAGRGPNVLVHHSYGRATAHQQVKLRRWGIAILLTAPCLDIGERHQVRLDLVPRHPKHLTHAYVWECIATGHIRGVLIASDPGQRGVIELEQQSNGIHSKVAATNTEDRYTTSDCQKLRRA